MKNRWNIDVKPGMRVTATLTSGRHVTDIVRKLERIPVYGWRAILASGYSVGIDDVSHAQHVTVILIPMNHEVPCVRNGRPGYRWARRYIVSHGSNVQEFPPVTRAEAYGRARELGATQVMILE